MKKNLIKKVYNKLKELINYSIKKLFYKFLMKMKWIHKQKKLKKKNTNKLVKIFKLYYFIDFLFFNKNNLKYKEH